MNKTKFSEIKGAVKGLTEMLQQRTGDEPEEVVWKVLGALQGVEPQNDIQIKFKKESLGQIEELFPDFLLNYGKDFTKSRLKTILKDLDENAKSVEGEVDFELYNYIDQIKNRVVGMKGKDTHKTKTQIENEIFAEMEYNLKVVLSKSEFYEVENDTTLHIENIKSGHIRIHNNNIQTVWDAVVIGTSSVALHNLSLKHGNYVSAKMDKELDSKFSEKYNYSKTTQTKYVRQVLDDESIEAYTKSNGKNKVELKVHPFIASLKSEKCLENTKSLTQKKLDELRGLESIEDFNKVLGGDDKPYEALKKKQKVASDKQKIADEKTMIQNEYSSIESSLSKEAERLEINPPAFTEKDYKLYRQKEPKDLIFDLLKEKYKLYQEVNHWKSKYDSKAS